MLQQYQIPKINTESKEPSGNLFLAEATSDLIDYKVNTLKEEDFFNKELWEEALKQEKFLPIFTEFLFNQKKYKELKQFLKDNFYDDIKEKIKKELESDLQILSSDNPEIKYTSMIYARDGIFFDFFGGNEKEIFKEFGLNKFYEQSIFDNLLKKDLDSFNLFLLGVLINYEFNGDFYASDCKRTIGNFLDLTYYYKYSEAIKIFADKVLTIMLKDMDNFFFILDDEDHECFYFDKYYENSNQLKKFFEDDENRIEAIKTIYEYRLRIPWNIIKDCDDLKEVWEDEDELQYIVEEQGYSSFEEMCEENL
jgi:hypothetical protein